jgi:hypothetical protein
MRTWLLVAVAFGTAYVCQAATAGSARCEFGAFVVETDPGGLNVRVGPGPSAKVVGRLPPMRMNPEMNGYKSKIEVDVLAGRNGWFQISNAQDNEELTGKAARAVFRGKGWVSGRKLSVKSQARKGFARPDRRSQVVLSQTDGESFDGDDWVEAGSLVACTGQWALVEFDRSRLSLRSLQFLSVEPVSQSGLPPGRFRAWIDFICGIQETSCSSGEER